MYMTSIPMTHLHSKFGLPLALDAPTLYIANKRVNHAFSDAELSLSLTRNTSKSSTRLGLPVALSCKPEVSFEYAVVQLRMGFDLRDLLAHP